MAKIGIVGQVPAPAENAAGLPHVCFVAPKAWPVFSGDKSIAIVGGAEVQQSMLARMLAQSGYPVSMICLDYGQPQGAVVDGVTVYKTYRPDAGVPVLRFFHPRLTGMWRAMADVDADIYYQRSPGMLTAVVAAFCRRHGKTSVYAGASDRDFLPNHEDIRLRRDRWLYEHSLGRIDQVVVQNEKQQRDCLVYYGRQATLIPSCYQLWPGAHPVGGDRILWVSTMHRDKRPELFLELVRRLPQFKFVMIGGPGGAPGDADYFNSLQHTAATFPNLEFTGFLPLPEVERWFDRAAVLVNTSTHEGMPNTFLQAWSRGIPTVTLFDTGSRLLGARVCNVVRDIREAASEISRLFSDELYRRRSSARCREYFAHTHEPAGVIANYMRLFDKLAAARSGR